MRSNYKRIGDFIKRVEKRNTDLKVTKLLGLSMTKEFRETTSNIVGTDMKVYRVMRKYQFACDFMSPIRVNKLPVVLKLDDEPNLVSPAYPVFEVKDRNLLDPEYLMMWFRRSEFDRYATFKCDGAIRGGYDWTAFCDTLLPIPTIAKQKEIVKEYNVIQNRIALNKQLIQKLEETAQAIYKQWFVDFEFPDENGKPYKSNGGEMIESELGKIPKGWEATLLGKISEIKTGPFGSALLNEQYIIGGTPIITVEHIKDFRIAKLDYPSVTDEDKKRLSSYLLKEGDIVFSRVGSVDLSALVQKNNSGWLFSSRMLRLRPNKNQVDSTILSYFLRLRKTRDLIIRLSVGSTMPSINTNILKNIPFCNCPYSINKSMGLSLSKFNDRTINYQKQNDTLEKFSQLILSKLAIIEN